MTPTEISQAYAELHDKWPELRVVEIEPDQSAFNRILKYQGNLQKWPEDRWDWQTEFGQQIFPVPRNIAHAACLVACLRACAERGAPVTLVAYDTQAKQMGYFVLLPIANPHTITAVMDRVMQLPKVKA